jgi:hypothetical protein
MPKPLSDKQKIFQTWLALAPLERVEAGLPSQQQQLATHLGVSDSTLHTWKKLPDFRPGVAAEAWAMQILDKLPAVFAALAQSATSQGREAARDRATLMRMIEPYLPQLAGFAQEEIEQAFMARARLLLSDAEYFDLCDLSARFSSYVSLLDARELER